MDFLCRPCRSCRVTVAGSRGRRKLSAHRHAYAANDARVLHAGCSIIHRWRSAVSASMGIGEAWNDALKYPRMQILASLAKGHVIFEVWRKSWNLMLGQSTCSASTFIRCSRQRWDVPVLQTSGSGRSMTDCVFSSFNRWTVLLERDGWVRLPLFSLISPIRFTRLGTFTERRILSVPAFSSKSLHMGPQISPRRRPVVSSV